MAEAAKIATPHIAAVGSAVASVRRVGDEIAGSDGAQTVIKGYVERVERLTRDRPGTLGVYVTTDSVYMTAHPRPAPSPL